MLRHFTMTPEENNSNDDRILQSLEEICENTRAIRRVVNRMLDQIHEYVSTEPDYDPDQYEWLDWQDQDDMLY